jgi:hypothetical protein
MNRVLARVTLAAGALGTLACVGAMLLAIAGLAGAGVSAGMAGMGGHRERDAAAGDGLLGFLLDRGPLILVLSIAAVVSSFALRRRAAVLPALAAGGLLYWGMYGQDRVAVMYVSLALGLAVWVLTAGWAAQRPRGTRPAAPRNAR